MTDDNVPNVTREAARRLAAFADRARIGEHLTEAYGPFYLVMHWPDGRIMPCHTPFRSVELACLCLVETFPTLQMSLPDPDEVRYTICVKATVQ